MNNREFMDKHCKYELGDILMYTATQYPYKVTIVNRSLVENDIKAFPKLPNFEVEYGCERLGRIDYLTACEHELEKIND